MIIRVSRPIHLIVTLLILVPIDHCLAANPCYDDYEAHKNRADSFDWTPVWRTCMPLAEAGDAQAQFQISVMYEYGWGTRQNAKASAKWATKAADQGHAKAQTNMGSNYYHGTGVPQDYATAMRWWRLAAAQGHSGAHYNIGVMYDNGRGVPKDDAEAARWLILAAELGFGRAICDLAVYYDQLAGRDQRRLLSPAFQSMYFWSELAFQSGEAGCSDQREDAQRWLAPTIKDEVLRDVRRWLREHRQ